MKQLITAETIKEARQAGTRQVFVSPGALITPQAKDDAKLYGIALVEGAQQPLSHEMQYDAMQNMAQVATPCAHAPHVPAYAPQTYPYAPQHAPMYGTPQAHMLPPVAQPVAATHSVHQPTPSAYAPAPISRLPASGGYQQDGQRGGPVYHSWSAHESHGHLPSMPYTASPTNMQNNTQPHRVVMNNTSPTQSAPSATLDVATQQLVEQVLAAVASASVPQPAPQPAPQHVMQAPAAPMQNGQGAQGAAGLTMAVMQRLNTLLAPQGGLSAFPGMESTIAGIVAEVAASGAAQGMPTQAPVTGASSAASIAGVDVVPFTTQQPASRVQGEVNIEEALLAHDSAQGPGVTRFSFADTSLVWTFTHHEVLVVTHGTVEVKASAHGAGQMPGQMLCQGAAMRVAPGTSLTLVAHGSASCVCAAWPSK